MTPEHVRSDGPALEASADVDVAQVRNLAGVELCRAALVRSRGETTTVVPLDVYREAGDDG